MEYKETAINQFREQVFNDYENYKKSGSSQDKILKIVGDVVSISQDIEMELAQRVQEESTYIKNGTPICTEVNL